jgi:hypothetical protein
MMRKRFPPIISKKGALGFKRRAADGLPGEFAAAVGAAASGLRLLVRHDAFQFSPHYYSILEPSIFAEWGLKSKRILVVGCSA